MSNSHGDPKLVEVRENWGMWGIGVWWDLVARVSEQYKTGADPVIHLSVKNLCQTYSCRPRKLAGYLLAIAQLELGQLVATAWPESYREKITIIRIDKVLKINDNYNKNLQATNKFVSKQEKRREKKRKETPLPPLACPDFLIPVLEAIATTRAAGKISDGVRQAIISRIKYYTDELGDEAVIAGCRIYVEGGYAGEGKKENYLYGIIRGNPKRQTQEKKLTAQDWAKEAI